MNKSLTATIGHISAGNDLCMEEMAEAIGLIMQGGCSDQEIGLLLMALYTKGESVSEVAGAAKAMRNHMTPIRSQRTGLLDTCGTGGDGSGSFNISTAAAIVTAATGVPVAKHGNRSITSKTGSADVLVALGVNIEASVTQVERCLEALGICFCFAPLMHPAMKNVSNVRKQLGVRTIFNLLGPLSNPAGAEYQLLGVGKPEMRPLLSEALALLGTKNAYVVCGEDGLDEVTLTTKTYVTRVQNNQTTELLWEPEDFGIQTRSMQGTEAEDPTESAAVIRKVFAGEPGAARDIVILNVAAALITAGKTEDLKHAAQLAAAAIDSGVANELLASLAKMSHAQ